MNIYEQNIQIIKKRWPELYDSIESRKQELGKKADGLYEKLYLGEALDGESFLAVVEEDRVLPLSSTYSPGHQAEQYVKQYKETWNETCICLFGLGNIMAVRKIQQIKNAICVIYEPSIDILLKIVEEYDVTDILGHSCFVLIAGENNETSLETILYDLTDYANWKNMYCTTFECYEKLFSEEWKEIQRTVYRVIDSKETNLRTLTHFSKTGMQNEIRALYWMIDGRAMKDLVGKIPEGYPCIMVAAGPSLEKNVEVLHQAKGKAFIICVDTALTYLLERGIFPDLAVTIDPQKGTSYFTRPELSQIPLAVTPHSDYRILEMIKDVQPVYFNPTNSYYTRLYEDAGVDMPYFDCGGSVGTGSFRIGVELGFKTIILVGQDLAFTERKAHAGNGKANDADLFYDVMMVDAYDGGKIMTRADFKVYIDWYNMRIPELKDICVINATEGGAKLNGAIQMTLQEAVDQYCKGNHDISGIVQNTPEVWDTIEKKRLLYQELEKKYASFLKLQKDVKQSIGDVERALKLLEREHGDMREVQQIERKMDKIVRRISEGDGMDIIVKRMIDVDASLNDDLLDGEEDTKLESIRLYQKMKTYLESFAEALAEMLPIWKETLQKINDKYLFE